MAADGSAEQRIAEIHHTAGHPGVRRTHYFVKQSDCQITRRQVQAVVRNCETCKSIDPAPIKWRRGCLSVERVWQRLAMDVTHVGGHSYLTLIDSGPSRSIPVRGAPEEILADNDTAFRSRLLEQLAERWNVRVRFRCAHNPSGNDIVERCHRTVKVIVARKECSVPEAVHLYNITPRDDCNAETAPANTLYAYRIRLRGIDARAPDGHPQSQYKVGDHVWVKPPGARCNTQYHRASVTGIVSDNAVEVNGIPRHVRHVRLRGQPEEITDQSDGSEDCGSSSTVKPAIISTPASPRNKDPAEGSDQRASQVQVPVETEMRRSTRTRRSRRCICCDESSGGSVVNRPGLLP
ncbi:hypothetical protein M514_27900 [Trichuris suis]|uniref:Integrase catalytic domain-containing protein n=1 Tax=Trichuris suis TaxID=68888 RepID=A0A085MRT3_9BILA|nr:hypothetical protein M514_27900 [Trichuris suis]